MDVGSAWRTKLLWAFLGVTVAAVYDLGNKLKNNDRLTTRGVLGDVCLQAVNAFIAVKLATLAGWGAEDTAYLALGLGLIGQRTALQIFRAVVFKYLGITAEQVASSQVVVTPPSPVSPAPARRPLPDERMTPLAHLGERYTSDEAIRGAADDEGRAILDQIEEGK